MGRPIPRLPVSQLTQTTALVYDRMVDSSSWDRILISTCLTMEVLRMGLPSLSGVNGPARTRSGGSKRSELRIKSMWYSDQ